MPVQKRKEESTTTPIPSSVLNVIWCLTDCTGKFNLTGCGRIVSKLFNNLNEDFVCQLIVVPSVFKQRHDQLKPIIITILFYRVNEWMFNPPNTDRVLWRFSFSVQHIPLNVLESRKCPLLKLLVCKCKKWGSYGVFCPRTLLHLVHRRPKSGTLLNFRTWSGRVHCCLEQIVFEWGSFRYLWKQVGGLGPTRCRRRACWARPHIFRKIRNPGVNRLRCCGYLWVEHFLDTIIKFIKFWSCRSISTSRRGCWRKSFLAHGRNLRLSCSIVEGRTKWGRLGGDLPELNDGCIEYLFDLLTWLDISFVKFE